MHTEDAPTTTSTRRQTRSSTTTTTKVVGVVVNPNAPKLTKLGYATEPPVDVLETMADEELAAVHRFAVVRPGHGRVDWLGRVDLRGVDLDRDVRICERAGPPSVEVYDDDDDGAAAAGARSAPPPVGLKLNRPATVTLEHVGPPDADPTPAAMAKFHRRLDRSVRKIGATQLDYDPATRIWRFQIQSFV